MMHQFVHASLTSSRKWIDEGLAHFAQAVYREQQGGRAAAITYMQTFLPPLQAAEAEAMKGASETSANKHASRAPGLITSTDEVMYRVKAMYVWWMLRDIVGDVALQQAIGKYRAADDRVTAYMPHLVEQAAKRDLEWFFDDWVYRDRGLPDFRIDAVFPRATLNGTYVVTVTVADDKQPGAEVPVFVRTEGGERMKRVLVRGNSKGVERLEVPTMPFEARVNDGSVPEADTSNNSMRVVPK
jgi:aminopeptidase N